MKNVPKPEAASGTMQESRAPPGSRAKQVCALKNPRAPAVWARARRPGPAWEEAATPSPRPVPGLLGLGPGRLQPQRALSVSLESASGRFLHGPPLGSTPGSVPPPLGCWHRLRVRLRHWPRRRLQLREMEEAVAPLGRDHLGRKPRRAEMNGRRSLKWRRAGGQEQGAPPEGQWAEPLLTAERTLAEQTGSPGD